MTRYESYNIDNDMWYKGRKHIYHLMGVYDGGHCACIIATYSLKTKRKHIYHLIGIYDGGHCACMIATYSLKTKRLLIKCANKHIPESNILQQFIEYAESKELREKQK